MALEIRELIIRVQVEDAQGRQRNAPVNELQLQQMKREIMDECMEKLKVELAKKKDR